MTHWTAYLPKYSRADATTKAVRLDRDTHEKLMIIRARTGHTAMSIVRALVFQAEEDTRGADRGGAERVFGRADPDAPPPE